MKKNEFFGALGGYRAKKYGSPEATTKKESDI